MRRAVFLTITCTIILGFMWSSAAYADKVGYINLQRLVNESTLGKAARVDIQKLRKEKEAILNEKLQEINRLKSILSKKGGKMDPAEKRAKLQEVKNASREYQRLFTDAKEAIVNEDRELVSIILKKADPILKKVAKKNNYTIILKDPNAVGYLDPSVDITDMVLEELNKK